MYDYLSYYQLDHLAAAEIDRLSISTRLMVHPGTVAQCSPLGSASAGYIFGLENSVESNIMDCDLENVPFFRRFGYVIHLDRFIHPEYGVGTVMQLDVHNIDRLRECRSPFFRLLKKWQGWPSGSRQCLMS